MGSPAFLDQVRASNISIFFIEGVRLNPPNPLDPPEFVILPRFTKLTVYRCHCI